MVPCVPSLQDQQQDYECVLNLEGRTVVMDAYVEGEETNQSLCYITCQMNQVSAQNMMLFQSSHWCWFCSAKQQSGRQALWGKEHALQKYL